MRLRSAFALVPDCHVPDWRYGEVWRRHFYRGLERSDVDVVFPRDLSFAWARPFGREDVDADARERTSRALLHQIQEGVERGIDVVISYCFAGDLELDVVDAVRARGIPWINFYCDSLHGFELVEPLARRVDLNWFPESAAIDRYRELGVPWLCAPYALDEEGLPDAGCTEAERPLTFVGAAHRTRVRTACALRLLGVDLTVHGWGWPEAVAGRANDGFVRSVARTAARTVLRGRVGGHLAIDDLLRHLRSSRVVLGLNEGGTGESYLKMRDVEFPGMGCCYLTQHSEDLEGVFEIGDEIRTFRSLFEAREVARDLARHPAECRRLARRARARVLSDHTWSARLPRLADALA